MADARRVHMEHRATRIAEIAPVDDAGTRWSPSPVVNAATGPEVEEHQGSSQPVTEPVDGRTATPSLGRPSGSHACLIGGAPRPTRACHHHGAAPLPACS
ncbi:hypothetical protein D1007_43453 [Hordeum vulgare]|nr:hypothetical protein D1007_43453 [Hordeum vulgare]